MSWKVLNNLKFQNSKSLDVVNTDNQFVHEQSIFFRQFESFKSSTDSFG